MRLNHPDESTDKLKRSVMKHSIQFIIPVLIAIAFQSYWYSPNSFNSRAPFSATSAKQENCYEIISAFFTALISTRISDEIQRLEFRLAQHEYELNNMNQVIKENKIHHAFVRYPNEEITQADYLVNYVHVIEKSTMQHFLPWLKNPNDINYHTLITTQHEYMVSHGVSGFYYGEINDSITGGKFRDYNLERVMYEIKHADLPSFPTKKTTPHLENISEEMLPWFRRGIMKNEEHLFRYEYPSSEYIETYVIEMSNLMKLIKNDLLKIENGTPIDLKAKQKILINLAKYYQLGMCAHVFERINNSLFMSHVNTILRLLGMSAISHGNLDFVALTRDSDDFVKYFQKFIMSNHIQN